MSGQGVQGPPLKRPGWGPAFSPAQFKVVFNCREGFWNVAAEEAHQENLLVGLPSRWTGSRHRSTALCQRQCCPSSHPPANLSCHKRSHVRPWWGASLDWSSALVAGLTGIAPVKLYFTRNGLITVLTLEEIPISYCPLLLLEGAGEEVEEQKPDDQDKHPPLPQEPVPRRGHRFTILLRACGPCAWVAWLLCSQPPHGSRGHQSPLF